VACIAGLVPTCRPVESEERGEEPPATRAIPMRIKSSAKGMCKLLRTVLSDNAVWSAISMSVLILPYHGTYGEVHLVPSLPQMLKATLWSLLPNGKRPIARCVYTSLFPCPVSPSYLSSSSPTRHFRCILTAAVFRLVSVRSLSRPRTWGRIGEASRERAGKLILVLLLLQPPCHPALLLAVDLPRVSPLVLGMVLLCTLRQALWKVQLVLS
jgi:hypothetical protein